jgi:hypothetical protein
LLKKKVLTPPLIKYLVVVSLIAIYTLSPAPFCGDGGIHRYLDYIQNCGLVNIHVFKTKSGAMKSYVDNIPHKTFSWQFYDGMETQISLIFCIFTVIVEHGWHRGDVENSWRI